MISEIPQDSKQTGTVYTNLDHTFDQVKVKILKDNPRTKYALHTAYAFCGHVWYYDGKWYDEIWQRGVVVDLISGCHLNEVIDAVNTIYGRA